MMYNSTGEDLLRLELLKESTSDLLMPIYALKTTLFKVKFGKEDDEFLYGDYVSNISSENSKPIIENFEWREPSWGVSNDT